MAGIAESAPAILNAIGKGAKLIQKHSHDGEKNKSGHWHSPKDQKFGQKGASGENELLVELIQNGDQKPIVKVKYMKDGVELEDKSMDVRKPRKRDKFLKVLKNVGIAAAAIVSLAAAILAIEVVAPLVLGILIAAGLCLLAKAVYEVVKETHAYKKEMKEYLAALPEEELLKLQEAQKEAPKKSRGARLKSLFRHKKRSKLSHDERIQQILQDPNFQKALQKQVSDITVHSGRETMSVSTVQDQQPLRPVPAAKSTAPGEGTEVAPGGGDDEVKIDMNELMSILNPIMDQEKDHGELASEMVEGQKIELQALAASGALSINDIASLVANAEAHETTAAAA